ncbi:DUF4132 domain-containing protein [Streptomyces sp. NPDC004539]|uniref:DUF4132 domain-containing protein n=1 Tax=Streptomyces sp. NPDC004539 TaxID=3154280 RepID=UPI0033A00DAE
MGWVAVEGGYEVALVEGRVTARGVGGRELKSVPKGIKDHPEVERLRRFAEWLTRHEAACVAQVDTWMVSSLPVPTELLARVWRDEAWRSALCDLVVVGDDPQDVGFLRDAGESGTLRVVDLDGETVRLHARTVTLPHPVLLPDLDELREFAVELGVTQRVEQLYRATWHKPAGLDEKGTLVQEFAGGRFMTRSALAARATSLGHRVTGSLAVRRVRDGACGVEAVVWIGEPWEYETSTGPLSWQDPDGRTLRFGDVGAVAWSEGMRMAAALYAGRVIEKGAGA